MGFLCEGKNTYLRDAWNILDFFVVISGIFGFYAGGNNVSFLRCIRLLRPLRSVSHVKEIRLMIDTLFKSLSGLYYVTMFLLFIILLFATFGMHLFKGMYEFRCRTTPLPVNNSLGVLEWPVLEGHYKLCNEN